MDSEMQQFIDVTIFIDTPLDIAMARRILRDFKEDTMNEIHNDLMHYINYARKAYLEALRTVKPNSDIVLDGFLSVDEIINQIEEELNQREVTSMVKSIEKYVQVDDFKMYSSIQKDEPKYIIDAIKWIIEVGEG